ncbi:helix-turn-helix transcriptional regulator [Lampropedia aestuarii]|uniref:Helix-turn-helix transcriptional regulator n=1 Tax=Lampropedia aestuarii TaxID=2562762 RepID=A0A4S5BIY7_9BURK|nr:helix-turn-helix transcriptional regulator [Lampropedia aestuarii]THJ32387.1 helix-turn-helix transcriptional regulator [Lampropedia aestuarii]
MSQIQNDLKKLRTKMSQSEISRITGVSQPKLSRWESGRIPDGADDALKISALARSTFPELTKEAAHG